MATVESVEKVYRGRLQLGDYCEAMDVLWLNPDSEEQPLVAIIQDDIADHGNYLTVRYFTSDEERSPDEVVESIARIGLGEVLYRDRYSEITGYLWTDEDLIVGGHDLLAELKSQVGRFIHMTIGYNREVPT